MSLCARELDHALKEIQLHALRRGLEGKPHTIIFGLG